MSDLTHEQIENRRKYVGCSEIAAICGIDPYRNAYDVWLDKTGRLEEMPSNQAMEMGNRLEPVVLQWAEEQIGLIRRNPEWSFELPIPHTPIIDHPDGIHVETGYPVQAKTAGLGWKVSDEWGDAGSDQVPEQYIVQATMEAVACGKEFCYLPVLLGTMEFRMYHIKVDPELAASIIEDVNCFWNEHVLADVPPEDLPHVEFNKRRKRKGGGVVPIDPKLMGELLEAKEIKKAAENRYEDVYNRVIGYLGEYEEGVCGETEVTFKKQSRKNLKRDPDNGTILCSEYKSDFRVLRIKLPKEKP